MSNASEQRIWVGDDYAKHGIFVLGESFVGEWNDERKFDEVYMREHVAGRQPDKMYYTMERYLNLTAAQLWHQCAYTNMVPESIGANTRTKATDEQFKAAMPRLRMLLEYYKPKRLFLAGMGHSKYSGRVADELNIPWAACRHPSGVNNANPKTSCTPEHFRERWNSLIGQP